MGINLMKESVYLLKKIKARRHFQLFYKITLNNFVSEYTEIPEAILLSIAGKSIILSN